MDFGQFKTTGQPKPINMMDGNVIIEPVIQDDDYIKFDVGRWIDTDNVESFDWEDYYNNQPVKDPGKDY